MGDPAQDGAIHHPGEERVFQQVEFRQEMVELEDESDAAAAHVLASGLRQREHVRTIDHHLPVVRHIKGSKDMQ